MRWIGTDESGKGDYFGGIVVAGVLVDDEIDKKLKKIGVRDCKKLSDSKVKLLAKEIKKICKYSIINISAKKYNELYNKFKNINKLLGWSHARVIKNLIKNNTCDFVICDKFGNEKYIENEIKKLNIKVIQKEKAEADTAVASASIIAREGFLNQIEKLSKKIGIELPKGSAAKEIEIIGIKIAEKGDEFLSSFAKLHFSITQKIKSVDMKRLWAPWRINYILATKEEGCIFCKREKYILAEDDFSFIIMNIYPYNNGHIMIAPKRHIDKIEELEFDEILSMSKLLQKSIKVIKEKMRPDGFNIGMNIGKVAGAGVEEHLHIHIVPRWIGDTNFMPIIGDTKIISESIDEAYKLLKDGFDEMEEFSIR